MTIKTEDYYRLRHEERRLMRMLSDDFDSKLISERTPREGEIANLLQAVRSMAEFILAGEEIEELEDTIDEVRRRIKNLEDNPESAGKHDNI